MTISKIELCKLKMEKAYSKQVNNKNLVEGGPSLENHFADWD